MFSCTRLFKLHKWGKWSVVDKGIITTRGSILMHMSGIPTEETQIGTWTKQRRCCAECGFVQDKIVKAK